jgi:5-methylcytosine-specific restriction endonuclease McrA
MKSRESELKIYTYKARKRGFRVPGGKNGGGWVKLAYACGLRAELITKVQAKSFVRGLFGGHGPVITSKAVVHHVEKGDSFVNSNEFLSSYEWRRVRMLAITKYGARCQCCGASPSDGAKIHVDHIKPRRLFPQLGLDLENLQILCEECNHGKGNWDMTDWRGEAASHIKSIIEEK